MKPSIASLFCEFSSQALNFWLLLIYYYTLVLGCTGILCVKNNNYSF